MEPNTTEDFLTTGINERNIKENDPRILVTSYMMDKLGRSPQLLQENNLIFSILLNIHNLSDITEYNKNH